MTMSRPTRKSVQQHLASLTEHPSTSSIDSVVTALAADALAAPAHPLMSLAATLRSRAKGLSPELFAVLRERAEIEITTRLATLPGEDSPLALPRGEWLTVKEAALVLGITEATLHERLRHQHHRRRLGWPMWDGHRFWIATAAVDPNRRAAFLAAQPAEEPLAELLPAHCRTHSMDDELADAA